MEAIRLSGNPLENKEVVFGHKVCQTRDAKWLCIEHIKQKFYRPGSYDIGGTCVDQLADYWFLCKIEQIGYISLLHLFISTRHGNSFCVSVSDGNYIDLDKKYHIGYLPTSLKDCNFASSEKGTYFYVTTYSFSAFDVASLEKYLIITVRIKDYKEKIVSELESIKLSHNFSALLSDPFGSDFIIESGDGDKFHVHRALLATHSKVFKAMLKDDTAESQNGCVKLVDVSTEDLRCIVEFIYSATVTDVNCNYYSLLALADRYDLINLRNLCRHAVSQMLSVDNAVEVLMMADLYSDNLLKAEAVKVIKQNPSIIHTSAFKQCNNADLIKELCEYLT